LFNQDFVHSKSKKLLYHGCSSWIASVKVKLLLFLIHVVHDYKWQQPNHLEVSQIIFSSALYYSLIETAKANSLNVYDYIWYCLARGPSCKTQEQWDTLLPWNVDQSEIASLKDLRSLAKPDPDRTEPYLLRGKR
jgi:hypothetical protein